jgi:hypothetical protein
MAAHEVWTQATKHDAVPRARLPKRTILTSTKQIADTIMTGATKASLKLISAL